MNIIGLGNHKEKILNFTQKTLALFPVLWIIVCLKFLDLKWKLLNAAYIR